MTAFPPQGALRIEGDGVLFIMPEESLQAAVDEAKAGAWDEGHAGDEHGYGQCECVNPYRSEAGREIAECVPCAMKHPTEGCADAGCDHNCQGWIDRQEADHA